MDIEENRPPALWMLPLRNKHPHGNRGSLRLYPVDVDVRYLVHVEDGAAAGDQDAAGPGGADGLVVDLLLVDDVGVVEGDVFRVQSVFDGGVEGVWGLRGYCHDGCFINVLARFWLRCWLLE